MRKLLVLSAYLLPWLAAIQPARAQDFAPASAGYLHLPHSGLQHGDGRRVESSSARIEASAAFPLYISPVGTVVGGGISWQRLEIDFRNLPPDELMLSGLNVFHSLRVPLFLRTGLNSDWSAMSFIIPGIESDFRGGLAWEDFSFQAALVFMRRYGSALRLGYGLFYSRSIGVPAPLPAFTLDWNPGGPWRARAIVPVLMSLEYEAGPRLSFGPVFRMTGNQYHGNPESWGLGDPKLEIRDLTLGANLTVRPLRRVELELESGLAFGRKFEFHDNDRLVADLNPDRNYFLRLGVRVPRP